MTTKIPRAITYCSAFGFCLYSEYIGRKFIVRVATPFVLSRPKKNALFVDSIIPPNEELES